MLIMLLAIFVLVVGIILAIIHNKRRCYSEQWACMSVTFVLIGTLLSALLSAVIIGKQIKLDIEYENKVAEKQMLEYRLEQGKEIPGNELLYTQIVEFNNSLRSTKKWSANPWTSWFHNPKIAELDYIELEEVNQND